MRTREEKKEYDRQYYLKNRDKILSRSIEYHKEHKERTNERQREFFHRKSKWLRVPGWTREMYLQKLEAQNGMCAICGEKMEKPCRDHDHETGAPRDLLCHPCNKMLGDARENKNVLIWGANYIQRHSIPECLREKVGGAG